MWECRRERRIPSQWARTFWGSCWLLPSAAAAANTSLLCDAPPLTSDVALGHPTTVKACTAWCGDDCSSSATDTTTAAAKSLMVMFSFLCAFAIRALAAEFHLFFVTEENECSAASENVWWCALLRLRLWVFWICSALQGGATCRDLLQSMMKLMDRGTYLVATCRIEKWPKKYLRLSRRLVAFTSAVSFVGHLLASFPHTLFVFTNVNTTYTMR